MPLSLLFGLALCVRLVFCFASDLTFFSTDSYSYIETAENLLAKGGLDSKWPPGYPISIAAIYALFGDSPAALVVFNCLLEAVTVCLIFLIARTAVLETIPKNTNAGRSASSNNTAISPSLWQRRIWAMLPWLAALALTFHPNVLNFTRQILSETLAGSLLVTAVYFALKGHPGWTGLFMGLCLLTRPSALFVAPILLAACATRAPAGQRGRAIGIAVLTLLISVFPASLKASLETKSFSLVSTNGPTNIIQAVGIDPDGYKIEWSGEIVKTNFPMKLKEGALHYYFRFAATHPKRFLKQRLLSLYVFFSPWPLEDHYSIPRKVLCALFRIPTYLLAAVAVVWLHLRHRYDLLLALAGPVAGLAVMHTVTHADNRFTAMVEPLLMVLAILSLVSLSTAHRSWFNAAGLYVTRSRKMVRKP